MYNGLTVPILLLKHNGEKYSPVSSVMPGYGPFLEMDAAIAELTSEFRGIENVPVGYTFCLIENDKPVEYWFTEAGNPESIEKKVIVSSSDSSSNEVWEKSGLGYKIKNSTNNVEDGNYAVATGLQNKASGAQTFVSGNNNKVTGNFAAGFGNGNKASGESSFASGMNTEAQGTNSHTEGDDTKATGESSHAEGVSTQATGMYSHSEGQSSIAKGNASHSEGSGFVDEDGTFGHAEGKESQVTGYAGHAEGYETNASGRQSHAEGFRTTASGTSSHSEGNLAQALGESSHAEGYNTLATGFGAHAEGSGEDIVHFSNDAKIDIIGNGPTYTTDWGGDSARVLIPGNVVEYNGIFATVVSVGNNTITLDKPLGDFSNVVYLNEYSNAEGDYSHVEGLSTTAIGQVSHAEGNSTIASGSYGAHAEGNYTAASGDCSHAEGEGSRAAGIDAHAEGQYTVAEGNASHAEGLGTKTMNEGEHACGKFNISRDSGHKQLFSVGIGTSNNARKNAIELNGLGDIFIIGIGNFSGVEEIHKYSLQEVITELAIANALYIKFTSLSDFMVGSLRTAIENYGVQTIINQYNELRVRSAVPINANLIHPHIVFENQNGNSKMFYLQSVNRNLDIAGSPTVYIFQSGNMELSLDTAGNVQIQTI